MTQKITGIIWDLDDTLIDTTGTHRRAQEVALNLLGISGESLPEYIEVWDRLLWYYAESDYLGIINSLLQEKGLEEHVPVDLIKSAIEAADLVWEHGIPLVTGATECLDWVMERNIPMAIVSNGDLDYQRAKIRHTRLDTYFSADRILISLPSSLSAKPNPDMLRDCCKNLSLDTSSTIYIGDRTSDVIAAHRASVTSVLIRKFSPESKEPPDVGRLQIERPTLTFQDLQAFFDWLKLNIVA